jgi:small subunit ribosomal protein S6
MLDVAPGNVESTIQHPCPRGGSGPVGQIQREVLLVIRAYEVMIIVDPEVDETGVKSVITRVTDLVQADSGRVVTLDNWGRRRFTHPLKRKNEGTYLVFELVTPASSLDPLDRNLRLADEIIRHKIIRLPDREATKRGLLGAAAG